MSAAPKLGPMPVIVDREAYFEMERMILDARVYSLLLGSVIHATGLEDVPPMQEENHRLNENESDQFVYLAMKLENASIRACEAFTKAFGRAEVTS